MGGHKNKVKKRLVQRQIQSYKHFTSVNYDSRVVIWSFSSQYNSRVVNYDCKVLYKIDHNFRMKIQLTTFFELAKSPKGRRQRSWKWRVCAHSFFFKKWANTGLFNVYFNSKSMWKMSCPFSKLCRDLNPQSLENESSPITPRPGFLPKVFSIQLIINKCSIKFCRWMESNRGPLFFNCLNNSSFSVYLGLNPNHFSTLSLWLANNATLKKVLKATALPTEPQPLPIQKIFLVSAKSSFSLSIAVIGCETPFWTKTIECSTFVDG